MTEQEFIDGQRLFTKEGQVVQFDHCHEDRAFVRPVQTTVYQSTSYSGDDFSEEVEETAAGYLIEVATSELSSDAPVSLFDERIESAIAELKTLKAAKMNEVRRLQEEEVAARQCLHEVQRQHSLWIEKHAVYSDLGRLLDGSPMFPLNCTKNPYHGASDVPYVPRERDFQVVELSATGLGRDEPWRVKSNYGSGSWQVRFFHSEEGRNAFISSKFEDACAKFRANPRYETTHYTSGTKLHFGTLEQWCRSHSHLSIPQDIVDGKSDHDAKEREAKKAELLAQAEAL